MHEVSDFEDWSLVEESEKEIEKIQDYVSPNFSRSGRSRRVKPESNKAQINVQRCIVRAIETVSDENPDLAKHLSESIRTGYQCQ